MANEIRVRTGFLGGLIEDNPLTVGATTLTSAALGAAPTIDSTNHLAIVLDPDGLFGAPEIVYVTAHSAAGTTATIARAQEGTSPREHARDIPWVHAATLRDFPRSRVSIMRNVGSVTITSTTRTPIDATNLPFVYMNLEIGDMVECVLTANVNVSGGSTGSIDFEVDQPSSANTYIATSHDEGAAVWVSERIQITARDVFTATERGSHGFRPVCFRTGGTNIIFNNAASGSGDSPIVFTVRYIGPGATS